MKWCSFTVIDLQEATLLDAHALHHQQELSHLDDICAPCRYYTVEMGNSQIIKLLQSVRFSAGNWHFFAYNDLTVYCCKKATQSRMKMAKYSVVSRPTCLVETRCKWSLYRLVNPVNTADTD